MVPKSQDTIGSSELFINDDGTIYHLGLAPHQLAETIITVGDPDRVQKVSKHFDRIEHKTQHREFITHTGYVGSKRLSVVSTGIGPDNMDIVLNEIDALHNIEFETRTIKPSITTLNIIRLGTCGALQKEIKVDSQIVSSYALGLDNLLHFYRYTQNIDEQYILNDFIQHTRLISQPITPYIAEGSISLRKHFASGGYTQGITVTCPGFFGPQGRSIRAHISYPNLIDALSTFKSRNHQIANFEMETSALYGLGKILKHQCLSISTVVANRITKKANNSHKAAIEQMIKQALAIIEKI